MWVPPFLHRRMQWTVRIYPDGDLVGMGGVEGDAVEAVGHCFVAEVFGDALGAARLEIEDDGMDG